MKLISRIALVVLVVVVGLSASSSFAGIGDGFNRVTVYDAGIAEFTEQRSLNLQPGLNTIDVRGLMPKAMLDTLRVYVENAELVRQDVTLDGMDVRGARTPVLHLVIDNKGAAGTRRLLVDYLAPDIDWRANYGLALDPGANGAPPTSAMLDCWVSLSNNTGADISAGLLDLVAGDINLVNGDRQQYRQVSQQMAMNANIGFDSGASTEGSSTAEVAGLSIFSRFTLGRDMILNANSAVSRFPLFQKAKIAVEERRVFENEATAQTLARGGFILLPRGLEVRVVGKNTTGVPMPAGIVTLYGKSGEFSTIVGQDNVPYVAKDQEFAVSQGRSSTLFGTRRVASRKVIDQSTDDKLVTKIEIVLTNRSGIPTSAHVREEIERYDNNNWSILETSHPNEKLGANWIQFKVDVPANGSTTISYTVQNY